jgi:hypothetical protein
MISKRVRRELDEDGVPVMTGDDDSTRTRLCALLDKISLGEAFPFVCCPELFSEIIAAYATGIDN